MALERTWFVPKPEAYKQFLWETEIGGSIPSSPAFGPLAQLAEQWKKVLKLIALMRDYLVPSLYG